MTGSPPATPRYVILGAGGVGGVIGGRLFQTGRDVVLIARGAHRRASEAKGLRLDDPDASITLRIPVVGSTADLEFVSGDIVILATKCQDAADALDELRLAAPTDTPVVCATNGVETERLALRRFANVYGLNVMMPTAYLEPGVVQVISAPVSGGLDIGRYPSGTDTNAEALARDLSAASFSSDPRPDIMRFKYRKLVLNTANAVEAACGRAGEASSELIRRAAEEAETVFDAAGLEVASADEERPKRALMSYRPIAGKHRGGGSTWQSVVKGGSVETDYLNGEIVLLGRLHGIATPVNEVLQVALADLARAGGGPGSLRATDLLALAANAKQPGL